MIHPFQGMMPRIGRRVFLGPDSTLLGDVEIGEDSSVWFGCVIRGDVNWVRIGARCNIQDQCCIHGTNGRFPVLLEDEVSIAHRVVVHGCTIRKGALVGMGSVIMDGAEVGEGCLVAAGSLLKEGFKAPAGTLVSGWPAVVKGPLTKEQRELVGSIWTRYVRYKEAYFKDGWAPAVAPEIREARPGFAEGHEAP